jgi:hypothetical protein
MERAERWECEPNPILDVVLMNEEKRVLFSWELSDGIEVVGLPTENEKGMKHYIRKITIPVRRLKVLHFPFTKCEPSGVVTLVGTSVIDYRYTAFYPGENVCDFFLPTGILKIRPGSATINGVSRPLFAMFVNNIPCVFPSSFFSLP